MRRLLSVIVIVMAVAACAAPQTDRLIENRGSATAQGAVSEPPFFAQRTRECGPAALAMALSQSGLPVTPDDLLDEVYNPGRGGSLTPAMITATRRNGRIAYPVGNLKHILLEIDAGRPVVVMQNLALEWFPRWHFAVAVAYDLDKRTITLHSGTTPFLEMSLSTFEHTWKRADFWAIVTLPPGRFPAVVDERLYIEAIAGVERAGRHRAAADAYRAAAGRWPDNLVARMGLGNALYGAGDFPAAAAAYRDAVGRFPDYADAYNNLADALSKSGAFAEAETAARRAVELGGPNSDVYRRTLRDVQAARRASAPET